MCNLVKKGSRLDERARAVGIGRDGGPGFNENRICSSTIKSHRLVQWVTKCYGWQLAELLFDVLNAEHFLFGKNLNDSKFLISCCKNIGLDAEKVREYLFSDEGRSEVINAVNGLISAGLDHIPVFVIDNRILVDGAPTTSSFIAHFRQIERELMQQSQMSLMGCMPCRIDEQLAVTAMTSLSNHAGIGCSLMPVV